MDIDFRRVASARQPRDFLGCAEPQMAGLQTLLLMHGQTPALAVSTTRSHKSVALMFCVFPPQHLRVAVRRKVKGIPDFRHAKARSSAFIKFIFSKGDNSLLKQLY
jgi:hypothetical protein